MKTHTTAILKLDTLEKSLFKAFESPVLIIDEAGVILKTNDKLHELFKYKKEELNGKNINSIIPQFDILFLEKLNQDKISTQKDLDIFQYNMQVHSKYENEFICDIKLHPLENKNRFLGLVVVNCTDKKIKEKNLRKSEAFLREAERLANIGHFEINFISDNIHLSQQCLKMLDIKNNSSILPLNMFSLRDFIHPEDLSRVIRTYERAIDNNETVDIKFRIISSNHKIKHLWNRCYINEVKEDGNPTTLFGVIHDITEQHNTEAKLMNLLNELEDRVEERTKILEQGQELYKMIARNFPNGEINVFDKNLNYVFVEGMELYKRGITGDMLIGTCFLDRIDQNIREDIKSKLNEVFNGENIHFELDTENKSYMIYAVGLPDENGNVDQVMMVTQNITALKEAESKFKSALEKEQHLSELKSRFVSMASHEFRTPLTATLNSVALLSKYIDMDGKKDKQKKHVNRIKQSIHQLNNILNEFLSLDKLTDGKVNIDYQEINLKHLMEEAVEDVQGVKKKGQEIIFNFTGDEEAESDENMLKHITTNLLSNAIKYSPENSKIEFNIENKGDHIIIEVTDEGIGIPENEQDNVFSRFFRAKNVSNIQGTGLGLNIVKSYIDMTNGDISFKSEENKGTTFKVNIPQNI